MSIKTLIYVYIQNFLDVETRGHSDRRYSVLHWMQSPIYTFKHYKIKRHLPYSNS